MDDKVLRIWKPVKFEESFKLADTLAIDNLLPSWFERREVLIHSSTEYLSFLEQLKREHAIETGIVERMYELEKGITETLIKKGFVESYISHGETNIPVPQLFKHLKDHLEAVDFVFDYVKENRQLTIGFIKELHALVTRSQEVAEGRDQFGHKTKIPLLKGKFKINENNPTRSDGTKILYCPPEQVDSEMDQLILLYEKAETENVHPMVIVSWFHHAFTTIHPFQDGNGRVARLLGSLICIKHRLFPLTVLREESKVKYIDALEKADQGNFQPLVDYFMEGQIRNIENALDLGEVGAGSLDEVSEIFSQKVERFNQTTLEKRKDQLKGNRHKIFDSCLTFFESTAIKLKSRLNGNVSLKIESCEPDKDQLQQNYWGQIIKFATYHNYHFNRNLPKGWIKFSISIKNKGNYQLITTLHHRGMNDSTFAIGAFLENQEDKQITDRIEASIPLDIKPYTISLNQDLNRDFSDLNKYLESLVTVTLAHIANEL